MKNYYEILNVPITASALTIKQAYRTLSMKYHPDKNSNKSRELFQNINDAYNVLSNSEQRDIYTKSITNSTIHSCNDLIIRDPSNVSDNNISPRTRVVENIEHILSIHISKIITGSIEPVSITRKIYCNNHGIETERGEQETIYVHVPKGTDTNEIITIPNKGNIYTTRQMSNIRICINIINDTPFTRNGLDLILHKSITLKESLCGFNFVLDHLSGSVTLSNKPGIIMQHGFKKILPQLGIPREDYIGNIIIYFDVIFPTKLTDEQVDLFSRALS